MAVRVAAMACRRLFLLIDNHGNIRLSTAIERFVRRCPRAQLFFRRVGYRRRTGLENAFVFVSRSGAQTATISDFHVLGVVGRALRRSVDGVVDVISRQQWHLVQRRSVFSQRFVGHLETNSEWIEV